MLDMETVASHQEDNTGPFYRSVKNSFTVTRLLANVSLTLVV